MTSEEFSAVCKLQNELKEAHEKLEASINREQELAAHLKRIKNAETMEYPQEAFSASDCIRGVRSAVNATPIASLAKRDMAKQAEVMYGFAQMLKDGAFSRTEVARALVHVALDWADDLRERARAQ